MNSLLLFPLGGVEWGECDWQNFCVFVFLQENEVIKYQFINFGTTGSLKSQKNVKR